MSNPIYEFQPPADEAAYIPWPGASGAPVPASGRSLNVPAGYRELRYIRDSTGKVIWAHKWRLTCTGNNGTFSMTSNDPAGFKQSGNIGICKNSKSITVTAVPNAGYRFKSWSDGSTVNPRGFVMTDHTSIRALFEQNISPIWMMCNTNKTRTGGSDYYTTAYDNKYSTDNGTNWYTNHSCCGARIIAYNSLKFVKVVDDNTYQSVMTRTGGNVNYYCPIYTTDGGFNWAKCSLDLTDSQVSPRFLSIATGTSSSGSQIWIAGTEDSTSISGSIYYSNDGINWFYGSYDGRAAMNKDKSFTTYNFGRHIHWGGDHTGAAVGIASGTDICAITDANCNILWCSLNAGVNWTRYRCTVNKRIIPTNSGFIWDYSSNSSRRLGYVNYNSLRTYAPDQSIDDNNNSIIMKYPTCGCLSLSNGIVSFGYSPTLDRLVIQSADGVMRYVDNPNDTTIAGTSWGVGTTIPYDIMKIEWGNGIFMAVTKGSSASNQNPTHVYISSDGATWSQVADPGVVTRDFVFGNYMMPT